MFGWKLSSIILNDFAFGIEDIGAIGHGLWDIPFSGMVKIGVGIAHDSHKCTLKLFV